MCEGLCKLQRHLNAYTYPCIHVSLEICTTVCQSLAANSQQPTAKSHQPTTDNMYPSILLFAVEKQS